MVSRPGFTLTWDIYQKKDKSALLDVNEKIIFSINGAPLFNWKFTEGHSDIQSEAHVSDPALLRILTELQKGAPTLFKIKMMEKLFPDLSEQTKNKLFDKYSKAYSLIYSLYFSDNLYQYSTLVSYLNPGSIETNPGTWYYVEPLLSSYSMPIYSRVLNMCLDYNIDNENMINSYVSTVQFNHETKVNPPSLWPETLKKITHLNYRTPFVRDINNAQYYAFVFENSPNLENMGFTSLLKDLSDGNQFPGKEFKPYDIDKLLSTLSTQKLTSLSLTLPADNELKGKAAKFVFGQKDLTDLLLSSEDPNNISYLNGLSELTNLQKLTFYNFSFERYIQYPKLLEYMLSKINKNNLEFLSFSRCNLNKLTEQGWFILLEFLSSVPHLKTITISGDFTNSSPALFQKLWATFIGMPELKEIEFNFKVSNLNKVFLDKFVETLKNKGINVKQNEFLN